MRRIRIIPVLLLKGGKLYKTVRFKNANYVGDPINTVKIFNEKGADELIVLDIGSPDPIDFKKIFEIAGEAFMPMAYGGGIRSLDDARRVLDSGYEKIVLNTAAHETPSLISEVAGIYGSQAVVVSLDVGRTWWGGESTMLQSGKKRSGREPADFAARAEQLGAGEILVNSVARDGTWEGYDLKLVARVSQAVSVPVIACGGAGAFRDFSQAVEAGASAVAAGSMFVYQKKGMGVLINFPSESLLTSSS